VAASAETIAQTLEQTVKVCSTAAAAMFADENAGDACYRGFGTEGEGWEERKDFEIKETFFSFLNKFKWRLTVFLFFSY